MERKFHGKRIDNGEWVEGARVKDELGCYGIVMSLVDINVHTHEDIYICEVIPESVGQHTGREDIHDIAIWDGSIVTGLNLKGCRAVEWDEYYHCFRLDTGMCLWELEKPEVVGNTTDNPELLEEGDV